MARIVVIGGTGYAGRNIVAEAAARGHAVVSVSRGEPQDKVDTVTYVQGSVLDLDVIGPVIDRADAVISALSARGDMTHETTGAIDGVAMRLAGTTTRLGVVGGCGGSLSAPGGPTLFELGCEEEYRHESQTGIDWLDLLRRSDAGLDWFYVHPAENFGSWVPSVRTGAYRDGGDVVVRDADGVSAISGADFAAAVIDEVETPRHRRERFTVGY